MTKMCFDQYATDWYLIPADMRDQFTEDGYKVTCAEDEFMEDGDESSARDWSTARRKFKDKYDQYKIEHHISLYVFENPQSDWGAVKAMTAQELALRAYAECTVTEQTTMGEPCYVAYSPEIPHCMGQGATPDEALTNLRLARVDLFQSLMDDGLPVPEPKATP